MLKPLIYLFFLNVIFACGRDDGNNPVYQEESPTPLNLESVKAAYSNLSLQDRQLNQFLNEINLIPAINQISNKNSAPIIAVLDSGFQLESSAYADRIWQTPDNIDSRCDGSTIGCNTSTYNNGDFHFGNSQISADTAYRCEKKDKACFHGTAVASLALGFNQDDGILGVCPVCRLLPVQITNSQGEISDQAIIGAFKFLSNLKSQGVPVKVVNASFGKFQFSRDVSLALKKLPHVDTMLIVAAAGNENTDQRAYPSSLSNVIAVASTDYSTGQKSNFSNYGPWVGLSAPSGLFDSLRLTASPLFLDGTSFAAPLVAGAAGLILSQDPTMNVDSLKGSLFSSADGNRLYTQNPSYLINMGGQRQALLGKGILNVGFALSGNTGSAVPEQPKRISQGCGSIGLANGQGVVVFIMLLAPLAIMRSKS